MIDDKSGEGKESKESAKMSESISTRSKRGIDMHADIKRVFLNFSSDFGGMERKVGVQGEQRFFCQKQSPQAYNRVHGIFLNIEKNKSGLSNYNLNWNLKW